MVWKKASDDGSAGRDQDRPRRSKGRWKNILWGRTGDILISSFLALAEVWLHTQRRCAAESTLACLGLLKTAVGPLMSYRRALLFLFFSLDKPQELEWRVARGVVSGAAQRGEPRDRGPDSRESISHTLSVFNRWGLLCLARTRGASKDLGYLGYPKGPRENLVNGVRISSTANKYWHFYKRVG